jgi:hypothetical protein
MGMKQRLLFALFLFFLIISGIASAQDSAEDALEEILPEAPYQFPEIAPEVHVFGGYRAAEVKGSGRADEYEYLHDSLVLGGELRMFSFPHRVFLDLDVKNVKDYFGDVGYAYRDIVLFRGINRTLFHNLDNITLIDLDPSTPYPGVDVRDRDEKYGVKFSLSTLFLRLKMPDFPFHVYLDGSLVNRKGTEQQISLLWGGFSEDIVRTSRARDIDLQTRNIAIGTNSHLGPVEVDFSHGEMRSDVRNSQVLFDTGFLPGFPNQVAIPHNLIPEFKGSSNTLKIHTSYTGGLVASATLSKIDRENTYSGSKADSFIGTGDIIWMPMPRLTFLLKYRHKEIDNDTPATITTVDVFNPSQTVTYRVRPSISSVSDTFSGIVRYRPLSGITLKGEYAYENIRRENAEAWNLPGSTARNTASLSADVRIMKGLNLKARYTHKAINDPAYNSEPDHSDEGRVSVSWIPIPKITTLLSYVIAKEKRDDLLFFDAEGNRIGDAKNRDAKRDRLLGSITFLLKKELSLTASYSYLHNNVKQDTVFQSFDVDQTTIVDPMVPYKDLAHNYSLDITYVPTKNMTFQGGVSYTTSSGSFFPGNTLLLEPTSIATFSNLKIRETVYAISGEYQFKNNISLGLRYKYSNFKNVFNNLNAEVTDGTAHIVIFTVSKRWN